jgi:putative PEP-CTERM system histidine kinase
MNGLIAFWSYGLAACLFASLLLWRLRRRVDQSDRLLLAALFATAMWATVGALKGPTDALTMICGSLRNLVWVMLLYSMSSGLRLGAWRGLRLVFAAVALVIGLQLILGLISVSVELPPSLVENIVATGRLLRMTMAAGALVIVHNIYGQAAPESRLRIRGPMLGLTLMWGFDLNLYTVAYLGAAGASHLFELRGAFMAMTAPLFAAAGSAGSSLKIKLSRAATFQSLSLLGICLYLAVMGALATALGTTWDWASAGTAVLLIGVTLTTAVLVLSQTARGWIRVKLAKHLFEHRYDYRTEWLRFTDTLGRSGADAPPLGDRIIKAFADIADSPGGLLLVTDAGGTIGTAAAWNWPAASPPGRGTERETSFWSEVEKSGRIIELEALRGGWADPADKALPVLDWMLEDRAVWAGIPLIHHDRLVGIVLLAAPDYRRALDWEDFDLLRTAGRQAASSLAEAHGQEALSNAQRFEEFNRRFAFILHDIKNLVSQLSLLSRNAERHSDNPEFRTDMIATLKGSVGKMNELLARLSPHAGGRVQRVEPQPLRPILTAAIASKRGDHEVRLLGDTNLWAYADAVALEQAIGHLLQNAVEACSPSAPVTVRVSAKDSTVAISIADKGVGMDSDFVRNQLFQPFASTKPAGFGIGAFEARALVGAMGGRLGVDSGSGRGTTFTLLLPAAAPASEPELEPQRKRA